MHERCSILLDTLSDSLLRAARLQFFQLLTCRVLLRCEFLTDLRRARLELLQPVVHLGGLGSQLLLRSLQTLDSWLSLGRRSLRGLVDLLP